MFRIILIIFTGVFFFVFIYCIAAPYITLDTDDRQPENRDLSPTMDISVGLFRFVSLAAEICHVGMCHLSV